MAPGTATRSGSRDSLASLDTTPGTLVEHSADTREAPKMLYCVFDCGPPRDERRFAHAFTNTGTAQNPRWMCRSCNGARKALDFAAKGNPESKEALANLRKTDVEQWKALVRSCRVRDEFYDQAGTPGLANVQERRPRSSAGQAQSGNPWPSRTRGR